MYSNQDNSYHSHYSEENIYKLAFKYKNQIFDHDGSSESFVVFVSNDNLHVPLWKQRVSPNPDQPVLWDYHVIFLIRSESELTVIDLDSTMGYRVPFETYVKETFRPEFPLTNKDYKHMFRVVRSDDYIDHFVSDRSHMIDQTKAFPPVYKQAPPPWPTIIGFKADCEHNADKYISMHPQSEDYYGKVMTLEQFCRLGAKSLASVSSISWVDVVGKSSSLRDVPLTA